MTEEAKGLVDLRYLPSRTLQSFREDPMRPSMLSWVFVYGMLTALIIDGVARGELTPKLAIAVAFPSSMAVI